MFDLADVLKGVPNLGTSKKQLEYIKRELIAPDPNNFYSLTGIEELAANIQLCGLQQPILVRPIDGGRYMVVSGHRRRAAIELLAAEEPEKWEEISCLVERDEASPELQQLRLIYANANTREKSSSELAAEAEQVEELLYKLKDQGYDFPGRMRDHVAAAVKASKSKLARLAMIRKNLNVHFMALWESGQLRDSVAYTLAQAPLETQNLIWIYQTAGGTKAFRCSDGWVQGIIQEMAHAEEICKNMSCAVTHKDKCQHCGTRVQNAARLPQYSGLSCRGCCFDCWNLKDCQFYCTFASDTRQVLRKKAQEKRKQENAEEQAREAPLKEIIRNSYQRVAALREAKSVSIEDYLRASTNYVTSQDVERLPKMESGTVSLNDRLPGGIWAADARRLVAVADLLGCSIDYLLGRTDEVNPAKNVPTLDTGWRTGEPDKPGIYVAVCYMSGAQEPLIDRWHWDGEQWRLRSSSGLLAKEVDCSPQFWIPAPPDAGCCITGMSGSGRCGAAAFCSEPATCCLQCDKDDCNGRCGWIEGANMSDYISREALIGKVEKHYCAPCKGQGGDLGGDWCRFCAINGVLEKVRGIPTARELLDAVPVRHGEMRWIPCSERLPELQDTRCVRTVLVCARGHVMPMIYERDIVQGKAVGLWKWMWRGIFKEPEAITHWMPLPEPPVKDGAEIYVSFADDSDFTGGSKP